MINRPLPKFHGTRDNLLTCFAVELEALPGVIGRQYADRSRQHVWELQTTTHYDGSIFCCLGFEVCAHGVSHSMVHDHEVNVACLADKLPNEQPGSAAASAAGRRIITPDDWSRGVEFSEFVVGLRKIGLGSRKLEFIVVKFPCRGRERSDGSV